MALLIRAKLIWSGHIIYASYIFYFGQWTKVG